MGKWKCGLYTFYSNPDSTEESYDFVGDVINTPSGRIIVQPTCYRQSISLETVFYQPKEVVIETISTKRNYVSLDYSSQNVYCLGNGVVDVYNTNLVYLYSINVSNLAGDPAAICFDGVNLFIATNWGDIQHKIYEVSTVDGTIFKTFDYSLSPAPLVGLTHFGLTSDGHLFGLRGDGVFELIDKFSGNIIKYYDVLANSIYPFQRLSGGKHLEDMFLIIKNGSSLVYYMLFDDKVLECDDILNCDHVIVDVCPSSQENVVIGVVENYNKIVKIRINTIEKEIFNLVKYLSQNKITLEDEDGNVYTFMPTNIDVARMTEFLKSYRVIVDGFLVI